MQEDKIKLYEELLAADPGSRLFLPLARLYLERGEAGNAISTLETGLNRYQEHFEARLLLHETLHEQGRTEEAREHLRMVSEVLRKYPAFWEHWAATVESEGQIDTAVGVRFLARYFQGREPGWAEVLRRGMQDARGEKEPPETVVPFEAEEETAVSESPEFDDGTVLSEEEGRDPYRTKTMADILVSQGDYAQALDIYTELEAQASDAGEREKLQERINWVKEQIEANSGDNQILEPDSEPEPESEPEQETASLLEPESEVEQEFEPEEELEPDEELGPEQNPEAELEPKAELEPEQEESSSGGDEELVNRLEKLAERLETRQ